MKALIDTQVLSAQFKRIDSSSFKNGSISSITANEFLWVYKPESKKPDYYILHPSYFGARHVNDLVNFSPEHARNKKWAKMGAMRTDQLIIDFNNEFPAYMEYGLEAVAVIINESRLDIFDVSILHIDKKKRRYLKERMQFLLESRYLCVPPNQTIISISMDLFFKFNKQHNCKENFRNSINDLIILATAIENDSLLISKDSLLNRFAAKERGASLKEVGGVLEVDFSTPQCIEEKNSFESKGYINRGWSCSIRRGYNVSGG